MDAALAKQHPFEYIHQIDLILNILAVGAHPDDIEFGCFATLAKLCDTNRLRFIIFTSGGTSGSPAIRENEARASAGLIRADTVFLKLEDGALTKNGKTVDMLRKEIYDFKPQIVFAPYFDDSHQDHCTVADILISSWRLVSACLFYETPSTMNFEPNMYVDVTNSFEKKVDAISQFKSQSHKPYTDMALVRAIAQYRAWQCYRRNGLMEGFRVFKIVLSGDSILGI